MEDAKKKQGESLSDNERQRDYLLGALEAKEVYLNGKHWELLLLNKRVDIEKA